jgi:hypothetical protein
MDKQRQRQEREIEKNEGIVRDRGEPRADAPSDRPEQEGELPHPQDVNEMHGHGKPEDKRREPGPTGSTPR